MGNLGQHSSSSPTSAAGACPRSKTTACCTINVAIPISKAVHLPRLPCQSLAWGSALQMSPWQRTGLFMRDTVLHWARCVFVFVYITVYFMMVHIIREQQKIHWSQCSPGNKSKPHSCPDKRLQTTGERTQHIPGYSISLLSGVAPG